MHLFLSSSVFIKSFSSLHTMCSSMWTGTKDFVVLLQSCKCFHVCHEVTNYRSEKCQKKNSTCSWIRAEIFSLWIFKYVTLNLMCFQTVPEPVLVARPSSHQRLFDVTTRRLKDKLCPHKFQLLNCF